MLRRVAGEPRPAPAPAAWVVLFPRTPPTAPPPQAATNLALHEARFLVRGGYSIAPLPPLLVVGGGLYFEARAHERPPRAAVLAVHNNFLIGMAKKVARFKENGLWLVDDNHRAKGHLEETITARDVAAVAAELSPGVPDAAVADGALLQARLYGKADAPADGLTVYASGKHLHARVVVVISYGDRPWFEPLVLPRVLQYATRVGADVAVVRGAACAAAGASPVHERECAQRAKLAAARAALGLWKRAALLDDTCLVRADAPDLFDATPAAAVGAVAHDWRSTPDPDRARLLALSALREGGPPLMAAANAAAGAPWYNTGVLVLTAAHHRAPLLTPLPAAVDDRLHGDQGVLNARVLAHAGAEFHDLGWRFNWLGSWHTANADKAPGPVDDAWVVHATTGLTAYGVDREEFLRALDLRWRPMGHPDCQNRATDREQRRRGNERQCSGEWAPDWCGSEGPGLDCL